jgi:predicted ATPase/DNA-binding CsgD family transcriptional regulator
VRQSGMDGDLLDALTTREQEILGLIAEGLSNQDIAERLFLTLGTVKWYNKHIYSKMDVRSRTQAIIRARELGLLGTVPAANVKPRRPRSTTSFVGRDDELSGIQRRLADPGCRLLTLFGPGGIGKTRMALEAAYRHIQLFDAVYFSALQATPSARALVPAIADVVGLTLSGRQEPKTELLNFLANKRILLVLDNFEHLLDGRDLLTEILDTAPQVKIMVTSRVLLNLHSEWLLSVGGLPWPEDEGTDHPESYPAVALFISRAQQTYPHFLPDNSMAEIIRICQLVEGMPLGIELATTWLKLLDCGEIANRIEGSIDFLATRHQDISSRHRSLRAVFEQSWSLLTIEEQAIFQRLAVFRGGFDMRAAEQVTGAPLFALLSLVEKSLLQRDESGRFHIHELLRQYAVEGLVSSNTEFEAREAHAAYFVNFLNQRRDDTNGGRQREVSREIGGDIDNIREAWRWAVAEINADYIQKSVYPLYQYFRFTSRYLEARDTFRDAAERLAGQPLEIAGVVRAELLCFQGWTCTRSGDIETAEAVFRQSYDIYETLGQAPRPGIATDPIHGFGTIALIRGDYAEATRIGELALARCEARGDFWNRVQALYVLSGVAVAQGDFLLARQHAAEAIAFLQAHHENWFVAYLHNQLGTIARALGDYDVARQHYEASYAVRGAYDDREGMALTLNQLGMVACLQGDYRQAQRHYEQSHRLYLDLGDRGGLGAALNGLGMVACGLGDMTGAQEHFRQAMKIAFDIHYIPLLAEMLISFGELCLKTGQTVEGVTLLILAQHQQGIQKEASDRAGQLLISCTADVVDEGRQRAELLDFGHMIEILMN